MAEDVDAALTAKKCIERGIAITNEITRNR